MIDRFQALRDIGTDNEEIRTIEDQIERSQREAQRLREETFKNDYRLGKLGIEIDRIEIEIKQRANDIKNCIIICHFPSSSSSFVGEGVSPTVVGDGVSSSLLVLIIIAIT